MIEYLVSPYYGLEFHPDGESSYAYKFGEEKSRWIMSGSYIYITLIKQIDTLNMDKHSYACNEDNQNNFMHCIENYYSKRLGCLLPWIVKDGQNNLADNVCTGKEKFKEFKNISMNILRTEETKDLIKDGCFIPNCLEQSWDMRIEKLPDLVSGFEFFMPQQAKVLLRKEKKLYTMINFFAEVGGYLGLLLGESLISYIIMISKWIHVISKKLKDKCRKNAEESNEK